MLTKEKILQTLKDMPETFSIDEYLQGRAWDAEKTDIKKAMQETALQLLKQYGLG